MPKTVTASTLVLAAIRDRVAALHAALEPDAVLDAEPAPEDATGVDDGGSSVTVPAAPQEVPGASDHADDDEVDAEIDAERLTDAVVDLEAAVTGFAPLIEGDDVGALRSELAWARSILVEASELEGTVEVLEELVEDLDPTLRQGPVDARLGIVTTARTAEQRDAVAAMLAQPEWTSLLAHADQLVLTAPIGGRKAKQAERVLARALAVADAAAREAAESVAGETPGAERRIGEVARAAAAVAVTARVTRAVHGKQARKLADAAEELVAALDERRRAESAAHWLVDLADLAHRAGEPGFTYGVLHTVARARRAEADEAVAAAVTAYTKPKLRKWLAAE